ncbi:MAG: hypothetical protein HY860_02080 [Chlamydiales bacterium]|nr:hypothetical protein [Chlamydiales bacterium]
MKHFGNEGLDILSLSLSLFLLMDGIGNVPLYLVYLKNIPPRKQLFVIIRELLIALFVIVLFSYLGEFLLNLLNISQPSLLISGGMILFIIALRMIFPPADRDAGLKIREPFIVPLAIPFIAGPSVLAAVMIYSKHSANHWILLFSILIAWVFTTMVLLCSSILKKCLGDKGLSALECLMGLILTLISVQMFLEGISLFVKGHCL